MDLKELTATIDKAVADLAQARADVIVGKNQIEQLQAEVASLKQGVETANTAKAEVEGKLAEALAKVAELEAAAETAKAEAEQATAAVKAEAEAARSQVETLTQRAEAAETKVQVFEQADIMAKRVAALEEAGVLVDKDEDAQKSVAMTQEEFDAFVAERIKLREAIAKSAPKNDKDKDGIPDDEEEMLKKMSPEQRQQMMKNKKKAGEDEGEGDKGKTDAAVAIFPVFEGSMVANRTLAALVANDPNAQDTLGKYAKL